MGFAAVAGPPMAWTPGSRSFGDELADETRALRVVGGAAAVEVVGAGLARREGE